MRTQSKLLALGVLFFVATASALADDIEVETIQRTVVRVGIARNYERWRVNLGDWLPWQTQSRYVKDPANWNIKAKYPREDTASDFRVERIENSPGSSLFFLKINLPRNATITEIGFKAGAASHKLVPASGDLIDQDTGFVDPLTFDVLGHAPEAEQLDGSKEDSYRANVGVDIGRLGDLGWNLGISGTLSTSVKDKEAKWSLVAKQELVPRSASFIQIVPELSFEANQAFTNHALVAKLKSIGYLRPASRQRSYEDAPPDWVSWNSGLAYSRLLRVDERLGIGDDPRDVFYGFVGIDIPTMYFGKGFGMLTFSARGYGFSDRTRKELTNLRSLEGYVDARILIPVFRPRSDRDGAWSGGTWISVVWKSGVVQENAFTRSSGLTYGLVSEFKF